MSYIRTSLDVIPLAEYGVEGIHPAADLMPMMSDDEFQAMCIDVAEQGFTTPVVIDSADLLIDGRNRVQVGHAVGMPPPVRRFQPVDVWRYVISENIQRRHLSVGQKALLACEFATLSHGVRSDRVDAGIPASTLTQSQAATLLGVSRSSVQDARVVLDYPDLAEMVRAGGHLEPVFQQAHDRREAERKRLEAEVAAESESESAGELSDSDLFAGEGEDEDAGLPAPAVVKSKGKGGGKGKSSGGAKSKPRGSAELIELEGMPDPRRKTVVGVPYPKPRGKVTFNRTTDAVDWASWTWNPVTGCRHGCRFCYAREIAVSEKMRGSYPLGFEPLFHSERLDAPVNTAVPASARERAQDGRVFVCSMADLFGEWVPQKWIDAVFESCLRAPEWEYLFLTKFPARYRRTELPPAAWFGASVVDQSWVKKVERVMPELDVAVRWLSVEPLLGPVKFGDLSWCDLLVVGAQSGTRQPDGVGVVEPFAPRFEWVADLVGQARGAGVPVYLKANLMPPGNWDKAGMVLPQEMPRRR